MLWLLTLLITQAHALSVEIPERPPAQYCLPAPVSKILQHATDYASYAKSSGANFDYYLFPNALKMTKSTEIHHPDPSQADSLVYIELRPLGSSRTEIYPRFFIRCRVTASAADHATHECKIAGPSDFAEYKLAAPAGWRPFAITKFTSNLEIEANGKGCPPGQTLISYTLHLTATDSDVAQVLYGLSIDEEKQKSFFQAFYLNFYKAWVQELPR
jgi:hypothetical protein